MRGRSFRDRFRALNSNPSMKKYQRRALNLNGFFMQNDAFFYFVCVGVTLLRLRRVYVGVFFLFRFFVIQNVEA